MAFPHVLLRFSNGIVNNFIVSFPLPLVYAQDVGRKPGRDARKTAESGFGQRKILRLSSHCFAFTFPNIRHFTPLRMTKWGDTRGRIGHRRYEREREGVSQVRRFSPLRMTKRGDARRSLDSSFPFWFPVIDRRIANEKEFSLALEMTMRGLVPLGVLAIQSPATSPQSLVTS